MLGIQGLMLHIIHQYYTRDRMVKPKIINLILFFLAKECCFYLFWNLKRMNFTIDSWEFTGSFIYDLLLILPLVVVELVLFLLPLKYAFKTGKLSLSFGIILLFFILDYYLYLNLASPSSREPGIYFTLIGFALFFIFFYRVLVSKISQLIK